MKVSAVRIGKLLMILTIFGLAGGWSISTIAAPSQVLILRHAEKPEDGEDLNAQGRARAQALVGFFETNATVNQYGKPVAIYATAALDEDSHRPIETIQPTADALGLPLNSQYSQDDDSAMVKEIMSDPAYDGKTVIICWHHGKIPDIARDFGARNVPKKWPGDVFDRVWVIRFNSDSGVDFTDLPEHVLPGDS